MKKPLALGFLWVPCRIQANIMSILCNFLLYIFNGFLFLFNELCNLSNIGEINILHYITVNLTPTAYSSSFALVESRQRRSWLCGVTSLYVGIVSSRRYSFVINGFRPISVSLSDLSET